MLKLPFLDTKLSNPIKSVIFADHFLNKISFLITKDVLNVFSIAILERYTLDFFFRRFTSYFYSKLLALPNPNYICNLPVYSLFILNTCVLIFFL